MQQPSVTCPRIYQLNILFQEQSVKRNTKMVKRFLNYLAGIGDKVPFSVQ